ncbi:DNA-binding IclR family transcriptional regulator [Mycoplana sp. BE70]|uniref:IclR family transcriptional regulator n=1 Tax=Mycoplana sp. BE70 TaxID=2817775 RepID=UPI002865E7A3|nr:IclR family transcriptional regulator [Mycoplana sp. BE70]MDR6759354.1 DNA-binding IclR family transcriptional regulator [Mycoplana sp. BE70]
MREKEPLQGMQSLERAMLTLRVVAEIGPSGAKLADVAEATGLSRSTAHRFLGALAQLGLLEQDEASGAYYLGMDLSYFGAIAANRYGLRDIAHPSMERLTERTGDTVYMSIRRNYESVCIERFEGDYPIKTLTLDVGDKRPLGVGAGSLALLAFQPDDFVSRAIAVNATAMKAWNISATEVFGFVEETRKQGFAYNPGRVAPGMTAIGVPVLGANGEAVAALGVGAITSRMVPERRSNIASWLLEEAHEIETRMTKLLGPLNGHAVRRLARKGSRGVR